MLGEFFLWQVGLGDYFFRKKNLCPLDFDKEIWYNIIQDMKRFMF